MTQSVSRECAGPPHVQDRPRLGADQRAERAAQRLRVLAAASGIFGLRGYHAAQMDEIADGAGISKPTVYKHFPSKIDLYLAVIQSRLDRLVDDIRSALTAPGDNRTRTRSAVAVYFDFIDSDPDGFHMVFETEVPSEPEVRVRIDHAIDNCVMAVAGLLTRDLGADVARVRVLAAGLVGICRFTARQWLDTDRPIPKSHAIALTAALCAQGLSGVPLIRHREVAN